MKFVCTSDLHGVLPPADQLPEGDILLVAGDIFPTNDHSLEYQFNWTDSKLSEWIDSLPYELVILVAGNHDFLCESFPTSWFSTLPSKAVYLQDSWMDVHGIKVYGTPWSTEFFEWAFMAPEQELAEYYKSIPTDTDILVSHGPPFEICDRAQRGNSCGSTALLEWVKDNAPDYLICGHIHEAYGSGRIGDTHVYNVAHMNHRYRPTNSAVVIEL